MIEKGGRLNLYHRWLARRSSSPDHADTGMIEKGGRPLYHRWLARRSSSPDHADTGMTRKGGSSNLYLDG